MIDRSRLDATSPAQPFLRPVDVLALAFAGVLLIISGVAWMRGIPGAPLGALRLAGSIGLILGLRYARSIRMGRIGQLLGSLAPVGLVLVDWALDPVTNLLNPTLSDPALLRVDRLLFGETPSVTFEGLLTPVLTEALLVSYLAFFTLVVSPVFLFWLRRESLARERYVQEIVLFFVTNMSLYLVVPAVGPRFVLAEAYARPLHGVFFGDAIREMFLHTPYFRDCFPSGHTAGTLLALAFTFRRMRGYFLAALPVGILCVCATVLCRFHYAIDLLCALPLVVWSQQASRALNPGSWSWLMDLRRLQPAPAPVPADRSLLT